MEPTIPDLDIELKPMTGRETVEEIVEELGRRSRLALARRRAAGQIMTYGQDGWAVREYPGQRVVRLCPMDDFKVDDWPEEKVTAMLRQQYGEGAH